METFFRRLHRAKLESQMYNTTRAAIVLALRQYSAFIFTARPKYLEAAVETTANALEKDCKNIRVRFLRVFLLFIESDNKNTAFRTAIGELAELLQYQSYLRAHEPSDYAVLLFLTALKEQIENKDKGAAKRLNKLAYDIPPPDILPVLQAFLEIRYKRCSTAYTYLCAANKKRGFTFFTHICLYLVFCHSVRDTHHIFAGFLLSSGTKGLYFEELAVGYIPGILEKHATDTDTLVSLYECCRERRLLERICRNYAMRFDYGSVAYKYFKEAETKQVIIEDMDEHLVRASFINKKEDVSLYTMTRFLSREITDPKLKSFAYHIILSNAKFKHLVRQYSDSICDFARNALLSSQKGLYYNGIYAYLFKTNRETTGRRAEICKHILYENLFIYEAEITEGVISRVWVFEKEKAGHTSFDVTHTPPYNPRLRVKTVSKHLNMFCFGEGALNNAGFTPKLRSAIPGADVDFYRCFHELYPDDTDLLIYMAGYYADTNNASEEALKVICSALDLKIISQSFREQLSAHMGNITAAAGRYDKAAEYFGVVKADAIADKHAEYMLIALLRSREFEKSVKLILVKSHAIPDKTLFSALKEIIAEIGADARLAHVAYELILKSYYDKNIVNIAVKHYHGSSRDNAELSLALGAMRAPELDVDTRVLYNAIESRNPDRTAQFVFVRMYRAVSDKQVISDFVYYLCYEMLVNEMKPERETISVLEKQYEQSSDYLLACALSVCYSAFNLVTEKTEDITEAALKYMEENGILFPTIENMSKSSNPPLYALKHTGFIHKAMPGRTVYLCLKVSDPAGKIEEEFSLPMKYMRFGLYMLAVTHFYNETFIYHYREQIPGVFGSIDTEEQKLTNTKDVVVDNSTDEFFNVNNAQIYEKMYRYDVTEKLILSGTQESRPVRGRLI